VHRCAERVFAHGIALKSRVSRARARAAASVRLLSRKASTNLQDPTLFDERDSRGHNRQRAGPEKGNTVARSKKVLQRGIRTWRRSRYQIGPAADLADNPRSLVLRLASRAQRQSAPRGCLLSVMLHLILRALHRARHFYAAAMTSARSAGNEGLPCDCCWTQIDRGLCGNPIWMLRGGAIARENCEGGGAFNDRSEREIRSPCVRARCRRAALTTDRSIAENPPPENARSRAAESMLTRHAASLHLFNHFRAIACFYGSH